MLLLQAVRILAPESPGSGAHKRTTPISVRVLISVRVEIVLHRCAQCRADRGRRMAGADHRCELAPCPQRVSRLRVPSAEAAALCIAFGSGARIRSGGDFGDILGVDARCAQVLHDAAPPHSPSMPGRARAPRRKRGRRHSRDRRCSRSAHRSPAARRLPSRAHAAASPDSAAAARRSSHSARHRRARARAGRRGPAAGAACGVRIGGSSPVIMRGFRPARHDPATIESDFERDYRPLQDAGVVQGLKLDRFRVTIAVLV